MTDLEIAKSVKLEKITNIGKKVDISEEELELYGNYKAKISNEEIEKVQKNKDGKLILDDRGFGGLIADNPKYGVIQRSNQMFNNNANYNQPPATNNDRRGTLIENLNQIKEEGNSYFRQKNAVLSQEENTVFFYYRSYFFINDLSHAQHGEESSSFKKR